MYFSKLHTRERFSRAKLKHDLWYEIAEIRFLLLSCSSAVLADAYFTSYVHFA